MQKYAYIFLLVIIIIGIAIFFKYPVKEQLQQTNKTTAKPISVTPHNVSVALDYPYNISDIPVFARVPGARDLQFSPGGTLLVSETTQGEVVTVDPNGDVHTLLSGLNRPHGLAFYNNYLYVAEERAVFRYKWNEQRKTAENREKLIDLPAGGRHFTRSIVFDNSGNMYVSLGSTCDTCVETQQWIATVITSDANGNNPKIFSSGLRNATFLVLNPVQGTIWATEMGRDYLGDDTPNDEIDILQNGKNYGWPYCYNNQVRDTQFQPTKLVDCSSTIAPIFEIPAHSAPLGLTFIDSKKFHSDWQGDLLVAYHGSWNRSVPDGYKIVHMKVNGNKIISSEDFITGFIHGNTADHRPVDVAFDSEGNLYISDDQAGLVYKLSP